MLFPNVANNSVPWISIILKRNFSNSLKQSLHIRFESVATTKRIPRWLCESATDKVTEEKSLDIEAAFSQRMEGGTAHRRLCVVELKAQRGRLLLAAFKILFAYFMGNIDRSVRVFRKAASQGFRLEAFQGCWLRKTGENEGVEVMLSDSYIMHLLYALLFSFRNMMIYLKHEQKPINSTGILKCRLSQFFLSIFFLNFYCY